MVKILFKGFEINGLQEATDDIVLSFANVVFVTDLDPFRISSTHPTGNKSNTNSIYLFNNTKTIVATRIDEVFNDLYLDHVPFPTWKGLQLTDIVELNEDVHYKLGGYTIMFNGLNLDEPEPKKTLIPLLNQNTHDIIVCMRWRRKIIVIGTTDYNVDAISSWNITPCFIIPERLQPCMWFGKNVYIPVNTIPNATYYAYIPPGSELSKPLTVLNWYYNASCTLNNYVILVVTNRGVSLPIAESNVSQTKTVNLVENFKCYFVESGSGFHEKRTGPITEPSDLYEHPDYAKWYDFFFVHSSPAVKTDTAFHLLKDVPSVALTPYAEDLSKMFLLAEKNRLGY